MYLSQIFPPRPQGRRAEEPPCEGDWCCPNCKDMQFARNAFCRRCGMQKPLDPKAAACVRDLAEKGYFEGGPQKAGMAGDWTCPKCFELVFANRPLCRRCHHPRPEGRAMQLAEHEAMAGTPSHEIVTGYVAPGALSSNSSWSKQWDAGSMVGMFWGRDVPSWVVPGGIPGAGAGEGGAALAIKDAGQGGGAAAGATGGSKPGSSASSSSGDEQARKRRRKGEKSKGTEAERKATPEEQAAAEKARREKAQRKEEKQKRRQEKAAKEQEQRRQMRERRQQRRTIVIDEKDRTIEIDD